MINWLANAKVYACAVTPKTGSLSAGILVQNDNFEPGEHTLFDEFGNRFRVRVDAIAGDKQYAYNVELEWLDAPTV